MSEQRLGRSLSDLLSSSAFKLNDTPVETKDSELRQIPVEQLQRGQYQPRRDMDVAQLEELANSVRVHGIIQPIVVRPISENRYEIIAGERRWRAAQMAELATIPALVREIDDQTAIALALIENIQRENLNPIEEANAIQRLIDELSMTHQQVADALGKSRASITNLLRITSLNHEVKLMLENGDLELGHAKVLLGLDGATQTQAARLVVSKNLSVRETERLVKRFQSPASQLKFEKAIDPDIRNLQNKLSDKLAATVKIEHHNKGNGKLIIKYSNLEELDGILERIN